MKELAAQVQIVPKTVVVNLIWLVRPRIKTTTNKTVLRFSRQIERDSMKTLINRSKRRFRANDLSAWSPEFWANESLMILEEELYAPLLVHRNFEALVQEKGDIVNTRRPNEYESYTKSDGDSVTYQDMTATNVQIPLDQHIEVTARVYDKEWSQGMAQMVEQHIRPMAVALARRADRVVFGQVHQFHANAVGGIGMMTDTNAKDYILYTREMMNNKKVVDSGRNLVLNNSADTTVLRPEWFTSVDKRGDNRGLLSGNIGHKFGFDFYRSNNMPLLNHGSTITQTGAINLAAGYPAGTTGALVVDGFGVALTVGQWVTVDGLPNIVVSSSGATNLVLRYPLQRAVADNAVIKAYTPAAVNNGAGYAAGYNKEITIDGTTVALQVGQAVTFKNTGPTTAPIYTVVKVNGLVGITLDRPLEAALSDNDAVNIGPPGGYNFAFHKNAIAFVNRALAIPPASLGVQAAKRSTENGLNIRVLMQYNAQYQFTQVTFDMLCGVKVLDTNLGVPLLS